MYKQWVQILQDHTRHQLGQRYRSPPPFPTPENLAHYLGPRPKGATLTRRVHYEPHGPGNTLWTTDRSKRPPKLAKAQRKATRKATKASQELHLPYALEEAEKHALEAQARLDAIPRRDRLAANWLCPIDNEQVRLLRAEIFGVDTRPSL